MQKSRRNKVISFKVSKTKFEVKSQVVIHCNCGHVVQIPSWVHDHWEEPTKIVCRHCNAWYQTERGNVKSLNHANQNQKLG
jgi:hypothetical protein